MDKEEPSWKEELKGYLTRESERSWLRGALSILIVMMGIGFMFISFSVAMWCPILTPAIYEYCRLQAIHNMLISIGFFLLAILLRVW